VLRRVLQHVLGERSHRPVSALMLFVEADAEVPLEERGETERPNSQHLRRDASVEDVPHMPAIIPLEQPQIVVRVVKYGLDGGIFEHPAEGNEGLCGNGKRIDDRRTVARGELQQIDTIDETMEARSLGIDRD